MFEKLVRGWGARQISKFIAGPLMVAGVSMDQVNVVVAVLVTLVLWAGELALSKINLDRLTGKFRRGK